MLIIEVASGWDEVETGAPVEEVITLDVVIDPGLEPDSEELGTELEKLAELETGVCVPDAVLLDSSDEGLTDTALEAVVEVPDGITGREGEGLWASDGV